MSSLITLIAFCVFSALAGMCFGIIFGLKLFVKIDEEIH